MGTLKFLDSATARGALVGAIVAGLFSVLTVTMGLWLPAHLEAPKLKEEVTRLEKVLASRDRQIAELQSLLVPFKTVAFQNFTGTEAERLSQLALKLNDVQKGLETLSNDQSAMKAKAEQINIYASEARQKAAELAGC